MMTRWVACAGASMLALVVSGAAMAQGQATGPGALPQGTLPTNPLPSAGTPGGDQLPAAPAETLAPQNAAAAPPGSGDAGDPPAEVVVTGIRQSLERAAEIKRDAIQVVDSIVAQDIGKLPDPTTAAALQRVPGVQVSVNRNNELGDVRVRGLPDVQTTVNGREVFTTTGRVFDLQDMPAEALARVDVFKSQTADLIEGGLAGTIDLQLNKPFTFRKPTVVLSARTNYALRDKDFGPQLGALVTNRWDTPIGEIGLLANGTYFRQGYTRASTILVDRRSSLAAPYNVPGLLLPNLLQNFPQNGFIERQQFNASGQWKVSPAVTAYAEGFYTYFRDRGAQQGANAQPNTASFGTSVVSLTNVVVGDQCFTTRATATGQNPALIIAPDDSRSLTANTVQTLCQPESATFNNIALNQTTQARDLNTRNKQVAGGVTYDQDGWKANGDVAYQRSRNELQAVIADVGQRISSITVDFDDDGSARYTMPNAALISPANLILRNSLQQTYNLITGDLFQAKADGQRTFDSGILKAAKVGLRYARRSAVQRSVFINTPLPPPAGTGSPNFGNNEANIVRLGTTGLPVNFLEFSALAPDINGGSRFLLPSVDFLLSDAGLNQLRGIFRLPQGRPGFDPSRQFDATEKTTAAFAQANYDVLLGNDISIDGVLGVRLSQTERSFAGFQAGTVNGVQTLTPLNSDTTDRDVLPAATARIKIGRGFQARAGYQKSIRRPNFVDLNPAVTLNRSFNNLVQSSGSAGNPTLKEQKSDSYDATVEYYFRGGYLALAGYYRNIKDRVITSPQNEIYDNITYSVSRPRNVGKADLKGLELSGQYFLDFLPGGFSGIGAQGSFTYSDSEIGGDDILAGYPLQGVSKYNYTTGLLYEKYGVSARLVYTYRSRYFDNDITGGISVRDRDPLAPTSSPAGSTTPLQQVPLTTYVRPAGRLDFNIGFDVSNALRIDLGGTNILKNRTQSYYNEAGLRRINNATLYDETTYTLGVRVRL